MIPKSNPDFYVPNFGDPEAYSVMQSQLKMLAEENARLRKAGSALATAAIYVATEYDGTHRLMLAVAEWAKAMADEYGRGEVACDPG